MRVRRRSRSYQALRLNIAAPGLLRGLSGGLGCFLHGLLGRSAYLCARRRGSLRFCFFRSFIVSGFPGSSDCLRGNRTGNFLNLHTNSFGYAFFPDEIYCGIVRVGSGPMVPIIYLSAEMGRTLEIFLIKLIFKRHSFHLARI
jgi:hypothetical protein